MSSDWSHLLALAESEVNRTMRSLPSALRDKVWQVPVSFERQPDKALQNDGIRAGHARAVCRRTVFGYGNDDGPVTRPDHPVPAKHPGCSGGRRGGVSGGGPRDAPPRTGTLPRVGRNRSGRTRLGLTSFLFPPTRRRIRWRRIFPQLADPPGWINRKRLWQNH